MFCARQLINLINEVCQRCLRLPYRDDTKDFQQVIRKQNDITTHQRNLLNGRSVQNCRRYSTTNNEFAFSVLLQHTISEIIRKFLQKLEKPSKLVRRQ